MTFSSSGRFPVRQLCDHLPRIGQYPAVNGIPCGEEGGDESALASPQSGGRTEIPEAYLVKAGRIDTTSLSKITTSTYLKAQNDGSTLELPHMSTDVLE